jgi:hypothetical protein
MDSLGIVQDSRQDCGQESALMAQIYGDCVLNIAATSANNGSEGCFFDGLSHGSPKYYIWFPATKNKIGSSLDMH